VKKQLLHVEYGPGEGGWASLVSRDPLTVRIENVPYEDRWNLHDIVSTRTASDGTIELVSIVKRKYPLKSTIEYPKGEANFKRLAHAIKKAGGACEGSVPGLMSCAHGESVPLDAIAKRHGGRVLETGAPRAWGWVGSTKQKPTQRHGTPERGWLAWLRGWWAR